MAVSFVGSAASSYTGTTSPRTATLTVSAGDVLVVLGGGSDGTTLGSPTNTGTALAWTLRQSYSNGTSWGTIYLWTAAAAETGSLTVTIARNTSGSTTNYGFTVLAYSGVGAIGNTALNNSSSGAPALSMTVESGTFVAFGATDFNGQPGSAAWLNSGTTVVDVLSNNHFYVGRYGSQTAGTRSYGLSGPTPQKWAAAAVELRPILDVSATRNVAWDVQQQVTTTRDVSWDVTMQTVTASRAVTWNVLGKVEVTRQVRWETKWLGTWREIVNTPEWLAMVDAPSRTISSRAELVDANGNFVQDLIFDTASIDYRGEAAEAWAGSVTFTDPSMAPKSPTDVLDPRSGLRARFWWRVLHEDQWFEVPVGTLILDDPQIDDSWDSWGISVTARDILSVVRRTGYGQVIIPVGGVTVDVAIKRLFAAVAPWVTVKVPPSPIVLPGAYQLGLDNADPAKDWTKLADMAGWVVRTDRMGTVIVGPRPERAWLVADWQEGAGCPVSTLSRGITQSQMFNRVLVRSTAQDAVGVYAVAEDDDPGSPSWVGRFGPFTKVIESDAVKTTEAALSMAKMQLGRYLRPAESVQVTVPQRPDLEYRDQIALARARSGVAGVFMVSGWTLKLGPADHGPERMSVTMMTRSLQ
ncbi:hypothetical protein [Paenarthrobacter nitroguajacolicus]|uniref:hypothetical protein n=1 Tax=Paenarthrobacter nitroguajacolicus TaxID=211146 RepID=UPI00248B6ABA|nr:hypothetical protein [Paenarthrobacter nitroguajacolicus]MDI2033003.1 hypothetical protein [Paenarthrobacter nitroguajacolicus]